MKQGCVEYDFLRGEGSGDWCCDSPFVAQIADYEFKMFSVRLTYPLRPPRENNQRHLKNNPDCRRQLKWMFWDQPKDIYRPGRVRLVMWSWNGERERKKFHKSVELIAVIWESVIFTVEYVEEAKDGEEHHSIANQHEGACSPMDLQWKKKKLCCLHTIRTRLMVI